MINLLCMRTNTAVALSYGSTREERKKRKVNSKQGKYFFTEIFSMKLFALTTSIQPIFIDMAKGLTEQDGRTCTDKGTLTHPGLPTRAGRRGR